ncbi:MAG TPA: RND transporter [Candidatus Omnitrophica bacterium]|nr:MAG: hypothetical protein A2Z81_06800 [Omnitrophica WOR_2 bacterium GWA2_45_18]OGX19549.1 MAG: hypothetical protein A2Y04_06445 [Omnitrophica WOR_2 bacterium GWC2_45_7]HBR15073.1 RND transporter [Candidatus Omnitrophota bacterium]
MNIKPWQGFLIAVFFFAGFGIWKLSTTREAKKTIVEHVKPSRGDIEVFITATGSVQPQNRLEMKPSINGRVEDILVREGDRVQEGQIVAWLSSTERAALLDAARSKGAETIQYWEEAYKPTPLIAPIEGDVIVRVVEPGQTVTSNDPVVVLSDRLIIKAQVDETDIGHVQPGQKAVVTLDAYPREEVIARVDHISYESKLVNNVTIYEVDILPQEVPKIFRSGMTANVNILQDSRYNVLRLPVNAVRREKEEVFVSIKENGRNPPRLRKIETGLMDEDYIEITGGLKEQDTVIIEKAGVNLPKKNASGSNPFMPMGGQRRR